MTIVFLVTFAAFAVVDWIAVGTGWKRLEYLAKPAALAALMGYAATGDDAPRWLLVALFCSLLGDVFLMLPRDAFVLGLGAFLGAHLAYVVALDGSVGGRLTWFAVVLVLTAPVTLRMLRSVPGTTLRPAVATYMGAIALMVASALASGDGLAISGALLFLASDALLGWNRFVNVVTNAQLAIIVTYHLGQLALATALR